MKFIKLIKANELNNKISKEEIKKNRSNITSNEEAANELCRIYNLADNEIMNYLNDAYWYSWDLDQYQKTFPDKNYQTHEEAFEDCRGSDGLSPLFDMIRDYKDGYDRAYALAEVYASLFNFL